MKIIFNAFVSLFLVGTLNAQLPNVPAEEVGMSTDRLQRISELSQAYVDNDRVASIVTMVARNGKIVYFDAFW